MTWLHWLPGRQQTGYEKLLLATWPERFDLYLLRYRKGASIPPHTDPVDGKRHYRVNVVLREAKRGGYFTCGAPIFWSRRVKVFRSDVAEHSVTTVEEGERVVLSLGWVT